MTTMTLTYNLRLLRRRVLALGLGRGISWGLAAGCTLLLIFAWTDLVLELPAGLRVAADAACITVALALLVWMLALAVRAGRPDALAQRMDVVAGTRGQILTGWDLQHRREGLPASGAASQEAQRRTALVRGDSAASTGPWHPASGDTLPASGQAKRRRTGPWHPDSGLTPAQILSEGLAQMAVDRAAALAGRVSRPQAAPTRALYRALGAVLALVVMLSIAALLMPRLARTQWLRFVDPFGDHPPYSPIILRVAPGDVQVVYGDGVDISVTAEGGTIDRVDLVLQTPGAGQVETLPMFPEPDGRWKTVVSNITQARQYFARAGRSRSSRCNIGVITVPRIEQVRFKITPPAYTNRAPYEGPLPQGGLAGLPGTRVDLWATSNRPLSGGSLDLLAGKDHQQVSLKPLADDPKQVAGTFEIRQAGRIVLKVTDTDNQISRDEFAAPVALLVDQRPFIRILQPPVTSFATPHAVLPVMISAEDDYGIARQEIYRSLNESRSLPAVLPVAAPPPVRTYERAILPLQKYGLQPGDVIQVYGRAEDNDPAGTKGSESTLATVHIISQEQFERMVRAREGMEVLQSKYEQANRRLESLAEQIEKLQKELDQLPPDSPLADEMKEKIRNLAEQLRKQAAEIRDAAEHELPYDIDKKLSRQLEDLAESLEAMARDADSAASAPGQTAAQARKELAKLAAACKGNQQEFDEQARKPLQHLAKVYPLIEDQQRYVQLYQQQRALADRLASLKDVNGQDDPAAKVRMRDMEAEQQQLHQELADLLEQIEQHAASLPDDPQLNDLRDTAVAFAQAVRGSGADEAMAQAQTGLADFNGSQGYASAKQAADILEKFLGKCKGMGDSAGRCLKFQPKLSEGLGQTVEQLLEESGMGTGQGGEGSGNGYSMRRSSLANVGIYGSLPGLTGVPQSGFGANAAGVTGEDIGASPDEPQLLDVDVESKTRATGTGEIPVPMQYRQRVGEYFKQIAEEQGQQK